MPDRNLGGVGFTLDKGVEHQERVIAERNAVHLLVLDEAAGYLERMAQTDLGLARRDRIFAKLVYLLLLGIKKAYPNASRDFFAAVLQRPRLPQPSCIYLSALYDAMEYLDEHGHGVGRVEWGFGRRQNL